MAALRQTENKKTAQTEAKRRDMPLAPGAQPTGEQAEKSPALALQAELHRRVSPKRLEMASRFVTLFFALGLAATWLLNETGSQTL